MTKVALSDHFTFKKIARISLSPILMMIFTSLYTIVDGIFVSNFASPEAFAGLNLIWPTIMIVAGVGFMLGTGGTALVSKLLGEQKRDEANRVFSLIIYATFIIGVVLSVVGFLCVRPIAEAMGRLSKNASDKMVEQAVIYGRILMSAQSMFMLQNAFQSFFVTAERPGKGFLFTLFAGITNMILDALFIGLAGWGVVGAALATIGGYIVGGVGPLLYFIFKKDLNIRLGKTSFMLRPLLRSMGNGISEFISNISSSIVGLIYNMQLLRYFGQEGVSAYGIVMYVGFVFVAMFIGYSIALAPVIGYHYGAKNTKEVQNVLNKSLMIIGISGVLMFGLSLLMAKHFSMIFASNNPRLLEIATDAMRIYSLTYLFSGFSMYLSSYFTALNNGLISGLISSIRTLVLQIACVFIFPLILDGNGIFFASVFAEVGSVILSFTFLLVYRKKYGYWVKDTTKGQES